MLILRDCILLKSSRYHTTFKRPIYSRQGNNDVADVSYIEHTLPNLHVEVERTSLTTADISITTQAADKLGIAWE